jgi:hypothetical protein
MVIFRLRYSNNYIIDVDKIRCNAVNPLHEKKGINPIVYN